MLSNLAQEILDRARRNSIGRMMVQLNVPNHDDTFALTVLATGNFPAISFRGSEAKAAWQQLVEQQLIGPSNDDVMPSESGIYEIIDVGQGLIRP